MKNKKKMVSLLPRMAISNIRKNATTYFPYIGVSIFAMFTYFVFDLILKNDIMHNLPKGAYAIMLVTIGFWLLGLIMVPFLYYTNSFLIKRRKKELGLYSILGLEKKHIGAMMLYESLVMYVIVIGGAVLLGLVFSKLIFLLLLNLARMPVNVEFAVSWRAVRDTMLFYAGITGLNLLVNLVQVGKANPVELMGDSKRGEKEPKHIFLWSLAGVLALGTGYRTAVMAKLDSAVFTDFFLAVLLVVIGTYFLFTSGSIAILRFLKSRKRFYYRPENFVSISGMLYRMKKNAASLSNICIFSTMVVITAVCTVSVYLDMDNIVRSNSNRDFEINFYGNDRLDEKILLQETALLAQKNQVGLEDGLAYAYVKISPAIEGNLFRTRVEEDNFTPGAVTAILMTEQEYYRMEEIAPETGLAPGEVLIFSNGPDFGADTVRFGKLEYTVKEELYASRASIKVRHNTLSVSYIVVFRDIGELGEVSALFGVDSVDGASYFYGFRPEGEETQVDAFSQALRQYLGGQPGFAKFGDNRRWMGDMESMYGSLLFIGIFFGLIFLICLLIIMYYKQFTEGFEDQKNFEVMQNIGMGDGEIRRTIKKQISMVFGLPLLGALVHTAVGMHMVYVLLGAIGFYEAKLLIACALGGCMVFTVVYYISYKKTSAAYYRIVRRMG